MTASCAVASAQLAHGAPHVGADGEGAEVQRTRRYPPGRGQPRGRGQRAPRRSSGRGSDARGRLSQSWHRPCAFSRLPWVLYDVPRSRKVTRLDPGTAVGVADLAAGPGPKPRDVALVRMGWAQLWHESRSYVGDGSGVPGVDPGAAEWLAGHGVAFATHGDPGWAAYDPRWPQAEALGG
ncbi:cyclase family protein [Nocardia fusca]|uniref:cyclase family protein n=1 Tax=Nocardia fusca TaxID=941183 RepID=UPI0037CC339B